MGYRNFDAERNGAGPPREAVSFQLCGETFRTLDRVPVAAWDPPEGANAVQQMKHAIEAMLTAEDVGKWRAIMHPDNKDKIVQVSEVTEIYRWLLEELSERPTSSRPPSSGGREATQATSEGG